MLVGHSTGGGEVTHYIGRHGTSRIAKALLVGAVPPLMLKTASNPGGLPIEAFDQIRAGVTADRSQFYKDLSAPFYGANRPGSKVSQGVRDAFCPSCCLVAYKSFLHPARSNNLTKSIGKHRKGNYLGYTMYPSRPNTKSNTQREWL